VGAQFGFSISWTMLFSYPLMAAIQEISGRIGRTTGRGIAGNIRRHYPAWLLNAIVGLLFAANTINIGADLGAMGDALWHAPHLLLEPGQEGRRTFPASFPKSGFPHSLSNGFSTILS
jgi:hypothetical protein